MGRVPLDRFFAQGLAPDTANFREAVIAASEIPSAAVAVSLAAGKPAAGNSRFQRHQKIII